MLDMPEAGSASDIARIVNLQHRLKIALKAAVVCNRQQAHQAYLFNHVRQNYIVFKQN